MKDSFIISEISPFTFKVSESDAFVFSVTEISPFIFKLTEVIIDYSKPLLITALLIDSDTIELTYNEDLNESIVPGSADYVFNGGGIGWMVIGSTFIVSRGGIGRMRIGSTFRIR